MHIMSTIRNYRKDKKAKIHSVLYLLLTQRHRISLVYQDSSDSGQMLFICGSLLIKKNLNSELSKLLSAADLMVSFTL